jgi:hypothetical protein
MRARYSHVSHFVLSASAMEKLLLLLSVIILFRFAMVVVMMRRMSKAYAIHVMSKKFSGGTAQ